MIASGKIDLQHDCHETNLYNPFLDFHTYDLAPEHSISSGEAATGSIRDEMMVAKKLNHNASERDRRKKVNEVYAFLSSLLPISHDEKKKISIPRTVSYVVKYIPELQKEVETLRCKKENLLPYSSSSTNTRKELSGIRKLSADDTIIKTASSVVCSVSNLGAKEVVIQLIYSKDRMKKNQELNLLSKVLEYLEYEEDELVLVNVTTFKTSGEGMLLSTLHLQQVQGNHKIESEKLKQKLCAFHQ
ncbi:putative transcription factor bHLH family [Helianthus debilis subsp. tardiflorus]